MRNLPSHFPGTASAMQPTLAATQRPPRAPHTWAIVLHLSTMALTAIVSLLGSHGVWAADNAAPPSHEKGYLTPAPRGEGFHFWHHYWELACDNTRTCRAAGYNADEEYTQGSVLLTRAAGVGTAVKGEVKLSGEAPIGTPGATFTLTLNIDEKPVGSVQMRKDNLHSPLPADVTAALLKALAKRSVIEFAHDADRWRLSDQGAAAVLLKMDEFQGRIGTPGALLRKGGQSEDTVRPPLPVPVLFKAALPKPQPQDASYIARHHVALRKALIKSLPKPGDCDMLDPIDPEYAANPELQLKATRLSSQLMEVSALCWRGTKNHGYGVWVVNDHPPFNPRWVTDIGSNIGTGSLSNTMFGHGCASNGTDEWEWDGRRYVHTQSATDGLCLSRKSPDLSWHLPTLVTNVKPAPR